MAGAVDPPELSDDDDDDSSDYGAIEVDPHDDGKVWQWLEATVPPDERPDLASSKDATAG